MICTKLTRNRKTTSLPSVRRIRTSRWTLGSQQAQAGEQSAANMTLAQNWIRLTTCRIRISAVPAPLRNLFQRFLRHKFNSKVTMVADKTQPADYTYATSIRPTTISSIWWRSLSWLYIRQRYRSHRGSTCSSISKSTTPILSCPRLEECIRRSG